jgi:hypothetical protein
MLLGEFPISGKHASEQVTSKIQVRERDNQRLETGDTRMYCSFLLRGSTSTLERCGDMESTNATKAHLVLR